MKSVNGPSFTRTASPISNSTWDAASDAPSCTGADPVDFFCVIGVGFAEPPETRTLGVLLTRCYVSSVISIDEHVTREELAPDIALAPFFHLTALVLLFSNPE